jgi:hypothetical protein
MTEEDFKNNDTIKGILKFYNKGIDTYIIDNLNYNLNKVNDGNVEIRVLNSNVPELTSYINQTFTIYNTNTVAKKPSKNMDYLIIAGTTAIICTVVYVVYNFSKKHFKKKKSDETIHF